MYVLRVFLTSWCMTDGMGMFVCVWVCFAWEVGLCFVYELIKSSHKDHQCFKQKVNSSIQCTPRVLTTMWRFANDNRVASNGFKQNLVLRCKETIFAFRVDTKIKIHLIAIYKPWEIWDLQNGHHNVCWSTLYDITYVCLYLFVHIISPVS